MFLTTSIAQNSAQRNYGLTYTNSHYGSHEWYRPLNGSYDPQALPQARVAIKAMSQTERVELLRGPEEHGID